MRKNKIKEMAMEMLRHFFVVLPCIVALTVFDVYAESQSAGFISIDCGILEESGYTDKMTGINYISDANFIKTGVSYKISAEYNTSTLEQQFLNVRSFPQGKRNCYTLKPDCGKTKFLIRARFMYGNYDGQGKVPTFNLLLEADVWDTVELANASNIVTKEIIHVPQRNYIYICLENTGSGTPFISALELRPMSNSSYEIKSVGSLLLDLRWDIGSTTNQIVRYRADVYDRIWSPYNSQIWATRNTSLIVNAKSLVQLPPSTIMQTGVVPANGSNSLQLSWVPSDPNSEYYVYVYLAEIEQFPGNQIRELNIYSNGRWCLGRPVVLEYYLYGRSIICYGHAETSKERNVLSISKTQSSTRPPILNALEVYYVKKFLQLLTDPEDVDAIMNITSNYGLERSNWQGDPCAPKDYLWQGLNCSYNDYNTPRIISLNLSSSGLTGEISIDISRLTSIKILDLSNNSLTGPVPDFLTKLPFLAVLNLRGNKLKGSIPAGLVEKNKSGLLSLRVDGNPELCPEASCPDKQRFLVPLLAAAILSCVLVAAAAILWNFKRAKEAWNNRLLELKNQRFSYSDVVSITNNFETVLGSGGFGTVYHGYLDDTQVAVKMLSPSSVQGYKQFQAEVELLTRVHHKNLTTLVGYCDEGINMGLIYEFMANGNLQKHLLGEDEDVLSWEGRLRIATEAAEGLEYLHGGCKPPVVHRDVKSTNILLNGNFQAKLADFGLSRIFPDEGGTHVSTTIAGTPGYLDPEYYVSDRLTEKSDVYSFGVVILEIITSKPVLEKSFERTHLIQWVSFMLAKADIRNIVDPRLQGDFDINSVSKAIEIAMACVSSTSSKRPTMNKVVMELKECLAFEIARKQVCDKTESKTQVN